MKSALAIITIMAIVFSCKKPDQEAPSTTTVYYVKVIAVDDNKTTITETKPAIVKVTQH